MRYLITSILLITSLITHAQSRGRRSLAPPKQLTIEQVKRVALDTVETSDPKTKIIVFSNNTWRFYHPEMVQLDELNLFRHNWDTTQIFAYRNIELSDLSPVINLKLIDDSSSFSPPTRGFVLSKYGPRGRRNHNGVDIPLKVGEPILSAFDGKVRYAKYNSGGFGYLVIIRHKNGLESYSAHLSRLNVKPGDYVKSGQVIGFGGSTGRSRGPHLHFEMRYADQSFDPEFLFDFPNGGLKYATFALEKRYFNIRSRASEMLEDIEDEVGVEVGGILASADDSTAIRVIENKPPVKKVASKGPIYHTVAKGDMLGKLALRYGVTIDQICRLNNITRATTLNLKQKLRIK